MTATQHHIIRQQTLEIHISEEAGAFALQQEVSRLLREQVVEKLQPVLSALVPGHQFLQLDKLEINLGNVDPFKAPQQFVQQVVQGIEKEVKEKAGSAVLASSSGKTKQPQFLSEKAAVRKQFLHFLETGLLPWWATPVEEAKLLEVINEPQALFQQQLQILFSRQPNAIIRLSKQYKEVVLKAVARQLAIEQWPAINEWIKVMAILLKGKFTKAKTMFWQATIGLLAKEPKAEITSLLAHQLQAMVTVVHIGEILEVVETLEKGALPNKKSSKSQKGQKQPITPSPLKAILSSIAPSKIQQLKSALKKSQLLPKPTIEPSKHPTLPDRQAGIHLEEGIFIQNAGLIMLAPLLPSFFEKTGLVKDKAFINEAAQERAVHLLQYLVTGTDSSPEHELTFNKILCGVPLDTPLEKHISLTTTETTTAQDLLTYVIQEWKALKNSSPATLQQLFLQRPGKLTFDEPNWTLRVEEQAMDVLLGRLPWGFSIVKLGWMEGMLFGEWG